MYVTLRFIGWMACAIPVVIFGRATFAALWLDSLFPSGFHEANIYTGPYITTWEHAAPWVWFGLVTLAIPAVLLFFAWYFKPDWRQAPTPQVGSRSATMRANKGV
jgi:hypothetical protein